MNVSFIRVLFVLLATVLGHQIGSFAVRPFGSFGVYGALAGAVVAGLVVLCEVFSSKVSLRGLSAAVFGLLMALIIANLLAAAIDTIQMEPFFKTAVKLFLVLVLSYLGVIFSLRGKDEFKIVIPYIQFQKQKRPDSAILLDSSAIIDGRVTEVIKTGFLDGYFVIPKFILKELQYLADSSDDSRRERGRRGLDILSRLKKDPKFLYRIQSEEEDSKDENDQKLVKLAKILDARIVTTDYNLAKIAEFHDIQILNINELSSALKPVLLPGERIEVKLVKEGKEREQAVAYLNDGTMIVVEDGRKRIGQMVFVEITSMLQTPAGRLLFARLSEGDRGSADA